MIAIDAFFVLLLAGAVVAAVAGLTSGRASTRADRGDSKRYRLIRRMAHELESVLIQDSNFPCLPNDRRASIEATLKEWEKQL